MRRSEVQLVCRALDRLDSCLSDSMSLKTRTLAIGAAAMLAIGACTMAPVLGQHVPTTGLRDGSYVGSYSHWPNSARVRVTISGGRIAAVELLHHGASPIGKRASSVIPRRILEAQSTQVDVVSGATNSSRVIMNAAQRAIDQAMASAQGGGPAR